MRAPRPSRSPRVLAVAGLEPGGRAGLLVDVASLASRGVQALGLATALTAQGTRTFSSFSVRAQTLEQQLKALGELGPVDAVKLGMVPARAQLVVLRAQLAERCPWVVDPVLATSQGMRLTRLRPRDYLGLAHPWCVVTPNLGELAWLLSLARLPASVDEVLAAGELLLDQGFGGVIVKGGHLGSAREAVDVVLEASRPPLLLRGSWLPRSRRGHRGTGCRFASVVAAELAKGNSLPVAARAAKAHVRRYLSVG